MHKKIIIVRNFGLSVFLRGATISCHAKAPDRRQACVTPRSGASGRRDRRSQPTRQTANRGVAVLLPGSWLGGGGGMRLRPGSAAGSKSSVGLRASVFFGGERRSLPARERRSDPGGRGLAISSQPGKRFWRKRWACLRASQAARARSRCRRLRMSVRPTSSSGDAVPSRGRRSSRGWRRIARFGAGRGSIVRPDHGRGGEFGPADRRTRLFGGLRRG